MKLGYSPFVFHFNKQVISPSPWLRNKEFGYHLVFYTVVYVNYVFKLITKGERIVLSAHRLDDVKLAILVSWVFAFLQNHYRKVTAEFAVNF